MEHKGTVSHGTMRYVDLIPTFWDYLLGSDSSLTLPIQDFDLYSTILNADSDMHLDDDEMEDAGNLLATLFDAMNDLAPEGYYFGAHEGDGSDYGFWELHAECTPKWCEEAHEPNSRCPKQRLGNG